MNVTVIEAPLFIVKLVEQLYCTVMTLLPSHVREYVNDETVPVFCAVKVLLHVILSLPYVHVVDTCVYVSDWDDDRVAVQFLNTLSACASPGTGY